MIIHSHRQRQMTHPNHSQEDSDDDDSDDDASPQDISAQNTDNLETTGVDASDNEDDMEDTTGVDPPKTDLEPSESCDGDIDDDGYLSSDDDTTESQRFEDAEARGRAAAAGEVLPKRARPGSPQGCDLRVHAQHVRRRQPGYRARPASRPSKR